MAPRRTQSTGEPSRRKTVEELFPELYAQYLAKPHMPSAFVDEEFLRSVGLYEQAQTCLDDSKWLGLLTLQCDTDVEDTCEFLASFTYERCNGVGFRYRHRGEWVKVPIELIRDTFGWQRESRACAIYLPMELRDAWRWMASPEAPTWAPSKVSSRYIARPLYYYLQHLLAATLFGRVNGSDKPNRFEMGIMMNMSRQLPSDYAHYWGLYLNARRNEGPIKCGGIITYLLRQIHSSPILPDHQILPATFLDRQHFSRVRAIKYSPVTGQIAWTYCRDNRFHQRLPRARRAEPAQHAPVHVPIPDVEIHQPQPTAEQRDLYFNLARVFQLVFPPGVQWVSAPHGWRVGMPVPEQYIIPGFRPRDEDDDNE